MAKRFTPEQERILNEWARTASELRRAFPYTTASDTQTKGFGYHLNKEVDPNGRFYIEVRQSDGLVVNPVTSIITFSSQDFYLEETSNPNEILVNSRGGSGGSGGGVSAHSALTGLIAPADDHTQYLLASDAGSRVAFASNWTDLTDGGETTLHTHDHGGLNGLGDDDHPQYLLRTEAGLFYGIVVKESDNSYVTRDDTIVFTSSDFNVADGADGKPTVTIVDSGIDHGGLSGLADDDHPQYARKEADWNTFRQGITAEAFYMESGGDLSAITRNLTLQNPSRRDTITFFSAEADFRITKMRAILRQNDSGFYPSVNFSLRHSLNFPSRGSGTELVTGGWQCGFYPGHPYLTADKNPLTVVNFNSAEIPQDSYVWLETTNLGEGNGIEEELAVSLFLER